MSGEGISRKGLLEEFRCRLRKSLFRSLDDSVESLIGSYGDTYEADAEDCLALLRRATPRREWPEWYVNCFVRWNREILLEQKQFARTGLYSREGASFESIRRNVYESGDIMEGHYLTGLFLSYLLWPHHYEMRRFFAATVVSRLGATDDVAEWGIGHGLFTLTALQLRPKLHVTAYDVSPHSLSFSQRVLVGAGFSDVEFVLADVTREEMPAVDFVICSELLEHVSEPQVLVNRAASSLRSGGAIFLTAAVNAPQFDHLTRFTSPIEVMEIVRKSNLDVSDSQLFTPLSGRRSESPPQVLALLALRKGSADG